MGITCLTCQMKYSRTLIKDHKQPCPLLKYFFHPRQFSICIHAFNHYADLFSDIIIEESEEDLSIGFVS